MNRCSVSRFALCTTLACLLVPALSWAHGFAGKRFFPTTLAIDDPFVSDELSFLGSYFQEPAAGGEPETAVTEIAVDYAKRITPHFGLSVGQAYRHLDPDGGSSESGFAALEVGAKYQFLTSEAHEAIASVGLEAELEKTGQKKVGAEPFTTLSPRLYLGKGLGDLPESVKYLRPFAVTAIIGPNFPTDAETTTTTENPDTGEVEREVEKNPVTLTWGVALEYNLQYLQSFVRDVGLGAPWNRMVAVVEFPVDVCLNRGCSGATTATMNPGLLWFGKSVQLGLEAQIPLNDRTGHHVGVMGLLHFFVDDLFPNSLGRPIFE